MKKVFILLGVILLSITLVSCKEENDYKEYEKQDFLNEEALELFDDFILDINYASDLAAPVSAIDLYSNRKNNYFNIYEGRQNKDIKIIAGYIDKKIIDVLDELSIDLVDPLDYNYSISGIDDYLKKYQNAVRSGKINEYDALIKYEYVTENVLPLVDNDKRLILVLEEKNIKAENIKTNENIDFKIFSNIKGYISSEKFYIKEYENEKNDFEHSILFVGNQRKYCLENEIEFSFLKIYDNKYIEERTNAILDKQNCEEYYQRIKNIIISEEKELIENTILKYDYIEFIKILREE